MFSKANTDKLFFTYYSISSNIVEQLQTGVPKPTIACLLDFLIRLRCEMSQAEIDVIFLSRGCFPAEVQGSSGKITKETEQEEQDRFF